MSNDRSHSRFGGSVCARYMACPGSVALCATVPNVASRYAAEGTAAHELAARCLAQRLHPTHFLGETLEGFVVTQEMCDAVVVYLNAAETEMARTRTSQFLVEQSFSIDVPGCEAGEVHGANDLIVYHPEQKRVRVFDYKHGVGVSVSAEDNKQLKFYALGAILANGWPVSEIILTIVQPRALDAEEQGGVKDWTFAIVDLLEFQGELEAAIVRAKAVETASGSWRPRDLQTGSHCRFCSAAPVCPAKEADALKAATLDFAGVKAIGEVTAAALPEPKSLDVERLARAVKGAEIVSQWLARCTELLEGLVLSGVKVPGWKVVDKIGRAKWIDDPKKIAGYISMLYDLGEDQLMPPKLLTITETTALLKSAGAKKADIDEIKLKFTIKESSGRGIAAESDDRAAVDVVASDFGSVNLAAIAAE